MNWYLKVLRQYADFNGRARRTEYWMFALFNMIFVVLIISLDFALGTGLFLYGFYVLAILVPSIAVSVRRLHDIGKSGWMILVSFIPIIGTIWLFVLNVTDGTPGDNEYGANPKEV